MIILFTGSFQPSFEHISRLEQHDIEVLYLRDERVNLKKSLNIDVSLIDAIVCNSLFLYNNIVEFANLKFIQLISAGFDRIDLDYCNEFGISVYSAKGVYSIPMAEWVILKILEIYKNTSFFIYNQKKKLWKKDRNLLELYGKTATIVGYGDIGKETAKRLKAFGVHINAVDTYLTNADYCDQSYLINDIEVPLSKSDIVILTLPLNEHTHHMFSDKLFYAIKDNAVLTNVSRGAIIDENSLIKYIGKFRGVALDVFEEEPLNVNSLLWDMNNVVINPHNSFVSENNNNRLFQLLEKNLFDFMECNH